MKHVCTLLTSLMLFFTQLEATMVIIKTNFGEITVELNDEKAPETVKNFLAYVDAGQYDGTIFHRVIKNFMIQGGGFTKDMQQKPTKAPIKNEATNGLKNSRGTLAMARTNDVNSATSQFFINVVDNSFLDNKGTSPSQYGYCVFGKIVSGMEVIDKIKDVKTSNAGFHQDVPVDAVEIISIKRKTND